MESIDDLCKSLNYNNLTKRYEANNNSGCGWSTAECLEERIIKTAKYSDRIEIVAANVTVKGMDDNFYSGNVGNYITRFNIVETSSIFNEEIIIFIKNNNDKYTYTFKMVIIILDFNELKKGFSSSKTFLFF